MSLGINRKPKKKDESSKPEIPVEKPIFLSGLGRSGTTIIHSVLAEHPHANWLSLFCAKYPKRPEFNRWVMHAIDVPLVKTLVKRRFEPLENYTFWTTYYGGFFRPCRDLTSADVTVQVKKSIRRILGKLVTRKRYRMLIKTTGMTRVSFLHTIFPDGKFIHVIRDGRAVAHSRMNVEFWRGWEGRLLWPGELPESYRLEWEKYNFSFVALAGIEWKANMDLFETLKRDYPHIPILEVRYEAFCANPLAEIKRMTEFCELEWTPQFEDSVRAFHVGTENEKWKRDLTEEQKGVLQDVLQPYLIRYGYDTSANV
jgi:hypothetical protein